MAFSLLALSIIALLLAVLTVLGILTGVLWARTRNLSWRVEDLEHAVRDLQADRPPAPREFGGGSTAIRE